MVQSLINVKYYYMNIISMMNRKIIALIATVAVISIGGMAYADLDSEVSEDERSWVKNMVNHGNDPTQKIGYGCAHGHMSFGCDFD